MTLRLGWFTAGRGPGSRGMFQAALDAIDAGRLDARIDFVFMHRERGEGEGSDGFIALAESRAIPIVTHSSKRFREARGDFASHREAFDARSMELLSPLPTPDLCVLAGYLLILSDPMVASFPFVNLHAALPGGPIGLWRKVIWELIDQRAEETGAMVFHVTPELDRGPPVAYARFPLRGEPFDALWQAADGASVRELAAAQDEAHPLFAAIREHGLALEPVLLVETLRLLAAGEVRIGGGHVTGRDGLPSPPRDLTALVDAALTAEAPR